MRFGFRGDEAHGHTTQPRATGAADAVGVVGRRAGKVVIHHGGQLGNINPACGQIGGHHHLPAFILELLQDLGARALAKPAVKRRCVDACFVELFCDVICGVLGGHENQHPGPLVLLNQVLEQLGAPGGIHHDGALGNIGLCLLGGGNLDAHGVAQQALRQRFHLLGEGGREKQVLAALRQQLQHGLQFFGKTQVQQAIGLVQHQALNLAQPQCVVLHQIQQPARRCHDHICAPAQAHHLRVDRDPPVQHGHPGARGQGQRELAEYLAHLGCQLARGHQHQNAGVPLLGCALQGLEQGQGKGGGFTGPRLGAGQDIASFQHRWNGRCLHRRGRSETAGHSGLGKCWG